jgi:hypothetical protein
MSKKASKRFFRVEIGGTGYYLAGQVSGGGSTLLTREETSADGTEVYDVDVGVKQIKAVTITFMDKPEERSGNQDFDKVKEIIYKWHESGERKDMQVVEFDDVKYTQKLGYSEYTQALCSDFSAPEFDRTSTDGRSFVAEFKPKKYKAVTSTGGTTKSPVASTSQS